MTNQRNPHDPNWLESLRKFMLGNGNVIAFHLGNLVNDLNGTSAARQANISISESRLSWLEGARSNYKLPTRILLANVQTGNKIINKAVNLSLLLGFPYITIPARVFENFMITAKYHELSNRKYNIWPDVAYYLTRLVNPAVIPFTSGNLLTKGFHGYGSNWWKFGGCMAASGAATLFASPVSFMLPLPYKIALAGYGPARGARVMPVPARDLMIATSSQARLEKQQALTEAERYDSTASPGEQFLKAYGDTHDAIKGWFWNKKSTPGYFALENIKTQFRADLEDPQGEEYKRLSALISRRGDSNPDIWFDPNGVFVRNYRQLEKAKDLTGLNAEVVSPVYYTLENKACSPPIGATPFSLITNNIRQNPFTWIAQSVTTNGNLFGWNFEVPFLDRVQWCWPKEANSEGSNPVPFTSPSDSPSPAPQAPVERIEPPAKDQPVGKPSPTASPSPVQKAPASPAPQAPTPTPKPTKSPSLLKLGKSILPPGKKEELFTANLELSGLRGKTPIHIRPNRLMKIG
jgi:hypothetical protein